MPPTRGHRKSLAYAAALTIVYWAFRLCCGPLALMAVGWSGGWTPVIVAQLLLASFVLPLAPTPGGSGARELGLAALLSAHVPEGQLLSGIVVYSGLTYYLPVVVGALFAGSSCGCRSSLRRAEGRTSGSAGCGAVPRSYRRGPIMATSLPGWRVPGDREAREEAPSVRTDGSWPQRRAGPRSRPSAVPRRPDTPAAGFLLTSFPARDILVRRAGRADPALRLPGRRGGSL